MNNPNKVNQYTAPDPRQAEFLRNYLDPKSKTYSNALRSALKAGYSKEYSENITAILPKWLSEGIGDSVLIQKAIRNLNEFLDDDKNPNIKADITKFVAKGLQKNKWSEKTETEVKGNININISDEEFEKIIKQYKDSDTK